jgi:hypothetical protein
VILRRRWICARLRLRLSLFFFVTEKINRTALDKGKSFLFFFFENTKGRVDGV